MNRPIRRVAAFLMILFLALMANATFSNVVRSGPLTDNPNNRRVRDAEFGADRGDILVGNTPVAASKPVTDQFKFQRSYPHGSLYATVTGHYSYFGSTGLEQAYRGELAGTSDAQFLQRLVNLATGTRPRGASIETTLDARAQQAAAKALGNRPGAVVAIDYRTGEIRALASSPTYDPNALATHDLGALKTQAEALEADPQRPLANRAVREIFPPGSTFKLVVSAAALDAGLTPESTVDAPTSLRLPGSTSVLNNAGDCGGTTITLTQALATSCNTAYANLGAQLGDGALRAQAEKFGFGTAPLPELSGVASKFPRQLDRAQLMMSSIGQFDVAATPLQMAMVAAGIANNGVVMEPHLVNRVRAADLTVVRTINPRPLSTAMTPANAIALQNMMVNVVANGTGKRAAIDGVRVGGKTGTALTDGKRAPYAWFVAWADSPSLAVAVFVQDAGVDGSEISGGRFAAPIAKSVIESMR